MLRRPGAWRRPPVGSGDPQSGAWKVKKVQCSAFPGGYYASNQGVSRQPEFGESSPTVCM